MVGLAEMGDLARRLGMRNNPGQLCRQGHQKGFLAFIEATAVALLNHQHAQAPAMVYDRHAQEGVERVLADLRQVVEPRVLGCVFEVDRFGTLPDQTHQPFIDSQPRTPHRLDVEPFGGNEQIMRAGWIHQVDGTHLRAHRLLDPTHDNIQPTLEVGGGVYVLNNVT